MWNLNRFIPDLKVSDFAPKWGLNAFFASGSQTECCVFVAGTLFFCSLCSSCWLRETSTPAVGLKVICLFWMTIWVKCHWWTCLSSWKCFFTLQMLEYTPHRQVNTSVLSHLSLFHLCTISPVRLLTCFCLTCIIFYLSLSDKDSTSDEAPTG